MKALEGLFYSNGGPLLLIYLRPKYAGHLQPFISWAEDYVPYCPVYFTQAPDRNAA